MEMVFYNVPEEHDDEEGSERHGTGESMGLSKTAKKEDNFVQATAMRHLIGGQACEPHLGNELVYKDDNTNGANEASQKGPAQDVVQEAESKEAGDKNEGTGHACHDASNFGIAPAVVVVGSTLLDVLTHNLADEERARRLGTDYHLRTGAQHGVYERV
jgi:hypothetical protein